MPLDAKSQRHIHDGETWAGSNLSFSSSPQVAKVEYVRRRPKLKEVFVRLEDHLECVCTSQHHVVEHSDAETGKFNLHGYCMSLLHYHTWCCLFAEKSLWDESCPHPSHVVMLPCRLSLSVWLCTGRPLFLIASKQADTPARWPTIAKLQKLVCVRAPCEATMCMCAWKFVC